MDRSKKRIFSRFKIFCHSSLRVGWFLAYRQIKRSSKWTTSLIIFVMMLTFLNLVFVSGILSGLIEGSSIAYRKQYSGDLLISTYESKNFISDTNYILQTLKSFPEVVAVTPRILNGAVIEANYKNKNIKDNPDSLSTVLVGINPVEEDRVTSLKNLVVAGDYLEKNDQSEVVVGSNLLAKYSRDIVGNDTLANVDIGDKIRIRIGEITKEVKIKGVVKSKIGEVGQRVYLTDTFLRQLINRPSQNVNEIAVLLKPGIDPHIIKQDLMQTTICDCAKIETWQESQGQFFKDIASTFNLLGTLIGSIGVAVASITVFIVIFINAITRRRYIGILKGIGICSSAIQISYMIQSFFYSLVGSILGALLLFGLLKPYIDRHPIDFPFSDGLLVAPVNLTIIRAIVLILVTILAGYIPAKMIVSKNTLNSILGR